MSDSATEIESLFPRLAGGHFERTSPKDKSYNCIAWAMGDSSQWWWPAAGYYWPLPERKPRIPSLDDFQKAFATVGFEQCGSDEFEAGCEKIAIFEAKNGTVHVALSLPNGKWTSKIGDLEDIEHELHALEGEAYGQIVCVMKRPRNANQ